MVAIASFACAPLRCASLRLSLPFRFLLLKASLHRRPLPLPRLLPTMALTTLPRRRGRPLPLPLPRPPFLSMTLNSAMTIPMLLATKEGKGTGSRSATQHFLPLWGVGRAAKMTDTATHNIPRSSQQPLRLATRGSLPIGIAITKATNPKCRLVMSLKGTAVGPERGGLGAVGCRLLKMLAGRQLPLLPMTVAIPLLPAFSCDPQAPFRCEIIAAAVMILAAIIMIPMIGLRQRAPAAGGGQ